MSETLAQFGARIEREVHEDIPELGRDESVWYVDPTESIAKFRGYELTRVNAFDPITFQPLPNIDARGKAAFQMHPPTTMNGVTSETVSDHAGKHENGHRIEELALRRGARGYRYLSSYGVDPTVYDRDCFQERLWRVLGCSGRFIDVIANSVHSANGHEWWAEVCGTVLDRTHGAFDQVTCGTFGGRVPTYGDPPVLYFLRALLKETGATRVDDPAGYLLDFGITRYFGDLTLPQFGPHTGLDIACTADAVIPAVRGGIVEVDDDDAFYDPSQPATWSGVSVWVRCDDGELWGYAHMHENVVSKGQRVEAGEALGFAGMTGAATGVHLHLERRAQNGVAIDPLEEVEMLSQATQDQIRQIVREETTKVGASIEVKLDSGFNTTMLITMRRVVRSILASLHGGPLRDPGVAYPDDTTPIA